MIVWAAILGHYLGPLLVLHGHVTAKGYSGGSCAPSGLNVVPVGGAVYQKIIH